MAIGRGRLPSLENLLVLDPAGLMRQLARFGIEPDLAMIQAAADGAFSRIASAMNEGVELDAGAWAALERQIELAIESVLRQQLKDAIREYRLAKLEEAGLDEQIWIAVMDSGTCDSCEERHGEIMTLKEWRRRGMPGSAALVCRKECRCQTLPVPGPSGADPYTELEVYL